ncbi:MAG: hypothetical protein ABJN98_02270 [Roseibium sp.]
MYSLLEIAGLARQSALGLNRDPNRHEAPSGNGKDPGSGRGELLFASELLLLSWVQRV